MEKSDCTSQTYLNVECLLYCGMCWKPTTVEDHGHEGTRRTGSQAVERALGLLRCFEVGPPTRSLSELAQLTGLTPATAHRLLRALCCAELLAHDPLTERYGLGVALVPLGSRAADALGVSAVRPLLESLAATTGESVNLGVRDGGDVLVLSRRAFGSEPALRSGRRYTCARVRLGDGEGPAGLRPRSGPRLSTPYRS